MKTFICKNCGNIVKKEYLEDDFVCSQCGTIKDNFDIYEDSLMENEIDLIIDSIIEDAEDIKNSKIININEEQKSLEISEDNNYIFKNKEKCINCGQCKKTCENITNISYDMRICDKPICIGCGQCVLKCPTGAISIKSNYKEIKDIIDANEKIVIAILSSSITSSISELNEIQDKKNIEKKLVEALKKLGFDFVFDSGFGIDLNVFEYTTELLERISKKGSLPMITSFCPASNKYIEIYHPNVLKNISTTKNCVENQAIIIKEYFCKKKGFDPSKIVIVDIDSCLANKKIDDNYIDYTITASELDNLLKEDNIDINYMNGVDFDEIVGSGSSSSSLCFESGGLSEAIIKTLYKLLNNKSAPLDLLSFNDLKEDKKIKETNIIINNMTLKVAVIQGMESLDIILKDDYYKKFHLIEVMNCNGGCIGGGGQPKTEVNSEINIKSRKYNLGEISKSKKIKLSYDNKDVKMLYKELLSNPYSEKCKELLHFTK